MKPWNKINWSAAQARHALKLKMEANFWQEWPEQGAFKEKGMAALMTPTDRTTVHALMVWSDDGGTTA